jgi:hypothetical protein
VLAETVPEYSPIEDALNELGKDLHKQKMPTDVVQQVYSGRLKPDVLTLAMTLDRCSNGMIAKICMSFTSVTEKPK